MKAALNNATRDVAGLDDVTQDLVAALKAEHVPLDNTEALMESATAALEQRRAELAVETERVTKQAAATTTTLEMMEVGEHVRMRLVEHRGGSTVTHGERNEDLAREFVLLHSFKYLLRGTLVAIVAVLATAAIDVFTVSMLWSQRLTDPVTGESSATPLELAAVSTVTLLMYFGVSWLIAHRRYRLAWGLYAMVVVLLAFFIAPAQTTAYVNESWSALPQWSGAGFAGETSTDSGQAPFAFWFIGCVLFGVLYSVPGCAFVGSKAALSSWLKTWRARGICLNVLATATQLAEECEHAARLERRLKTYADQPAARARAAVRQLRAEADSENRRAGHAASATTTNLLRPKAEQRHAAATLVEVARTAEQLRRVKGAVGVMVFLLLATHSAFAQNSSRNAADVIAAAPSFQLLLDASGGSPALSDSVTARVVPFLREQLGTMSVGSMVTVTSVGDSAEPAAMWGSRLLRRSTNVGMSSADIISRVQALVLGFPARMRGHEQGASHLVGAFFNASRNINPKASTPNVIVMISDLLENSPFSCPPNTRCRPLTPPFSLPNTKVFVYGVGYQGVSSPDLIALTKRWEAFLKKTGALQVELHTTF